MLSQHVTFDETSLLKSTISQQVERMKTKDVSQLIEVNSTPSSSIGSLSVGISLDATPNKEHIAVLNVEHFDLIAV